MSTPEGYVLRRPETSDLAEIAALVSAADAEGGEVAVASDIEREWGSLDVANDVWVVAAADGELAAYLETAARGTDRVASDAYVHPAHTGRGLGNFALVLAEQRARELLGGPGRITNATLDTNDAAVGLFESRGYRPIRHFFRMVIDLDSEPAAPEWPDGLDPRPFDRAHARDFHAVLEDAFAEEFGHQPEAFEEWEERRVNASFVDLRLWLGVWDGDELAATMVCDPERFEMGWIGAVGVRKPWRRRGLGLALLRHAFGEFWRRGQRRVGLGVDAENPTGATRLYERAGMRILFDAVVFEKDLT